MVKKKKEKEEIKQATVTIPLFGRKNYWYCSETAYTIRKQIHPRYSIHPWKERNTGKRKLYTMYPCNIFAYLNTDLLYLLNIASL